MPKPTKCPQCDHEFDPQAGALPQSELPDISTVDISGATDALSHQARRGQRAPIARFVRWLGLFALVALFVGIVASMDLSAPSISKPENNSGTQRPKQTKPIANAAQGTADDRSDLLMSIENSIVQIKSGGPAGANSLGSGFVVDSTGLVATNYHVVSEATTGSVYFKNGASYEIEGYVAVEPEVDLAILKLRNAPQNLSPLRLQIEKKPQPLSEVVAIGHPHGLSFSPYDGKVSQVLTTSQLPDRSRRFVVGHMKSNRDHRWVQHTVVLSEGNSGGPLLNRRGEVLGINTWVDNQTRFGYALGAEHLHDLLARPLPHVAALEEYATKEAQTTARFERLSPDRIRNLFDEAKQFHWAPSTGDQYQALQQLACLVTVARFPGSYGDAATLDESLLDELIQAADEVELELRNVKGPLLESSAFINEYALQQIQRAGGVFFVATVQRLVSSDDGSRGMMVQLSGSKQSVFIPLDGLLLEPQPAEFLLILGMNHNGRYVQFGDNPLKLNKAPVVVSRTMLSLGE